MTDSMIPREKSYEEKIQESKPEGKAVKFHKEFTLISNLSKPARTSFELTLLSIAKTIGISNIDANQTKSVLTFLEKYFGNQITTEEVKYAFELYVLGEIAIAEKKGHFGTFHIEFVTAVIQAYIEFRWEPLKASQRALPAATEPPMSWEELGKVMDKIIRDYIGQHNKLPFMASYHAAFGYLDSIGEIKATKEERIAFKERIRQQLAAPDYSEKTQIGNIYAARKADQEENLRTMCREELAKAYYTNLLLKQSNSESNETQA